VPIREVDISLEHIVDILTVTGTLKGEGGWLPNLVVKVSQHDLLGVIRQE